MIIVEIAVSQLHEAPWNANRMDAAMTVRLGESLRRFGLVQNLVVREINNECFEVLSGNQRLRLLKEQGFESVPCAVVQLNDANARILAQALNRVQGEDEIGVKASLVKQILSTIPQSEVLAILPETTASLNSLSSFGSQNLESFLKNWEAARSVRLKHLQLQLTPSQLQVIDMALKKAAPHVSISKRDGPNARSAALTFICRKFLEQEDRID